MKLFDRPYLLLTLTTLFWAGNAIAGKLAAGVIPPFTLTFVRWTLVVAIVYVVARPHLAAHRDIIRKHGLFVMLLGVLGFSFFNFALYGALNFTSALNVSIEQSAFPSVVMLLMFIIYRERISALQGVGVLLSVIGIAITVSQGSLDRLLALEFNIGDVIMMLGVFVYSLYSILLRYRPQLPWHIFMLIMAIGAALVALPPAIWEVANGVYPQASWKVPALLAYIILFPSLLSQVFWVRGVELIGPSRASVFINLVPVFGSGLAVLIVGEVFAAYHAAGIVFVVSGVMLAEWAGKRRADRIAAQSSPESVPK
ncbi:DMT family transporter [Ahrensia marina]|uniref:DMT family transporter n=1 Tax=Ahrensia marina TaxID=1514904 RepID=UPI0035D0107F